MKILNKDLEGVVTRLNTLTKQPLTPWTRTGGKSVANIGNYHLSWAYGGVTLHQMDNEGGGVRDVLYCGYTTKKELYYRIHSYISGLMNSL